MGRLRMHAVGHLVWALVLVISSSAVLGWTEAPIAQSRSGVIEGIVVDAHGAIPGATVTLERESRIVGRAITNENGKFRFDHLSMGHYRAKTTMSGFVEDRRDVILSDGQPAAEVSIVLQVSGVTEMVTVQATPLTLQTTTASSSAYHVAREMTYPGERYGRFTANQFKRTVQEPLSTFAADVDTAAYTNIRRFLSKGQLPPAEAVRVEEMLNYFRFDYPVPAGAQPLAVATETGSCPWAPSHQLLLVGVRAKAIDQANINGRNIVLLIDVSGSMASPDKMGLVKSALRMFVDTLRGDDRVAMVVYAGASGLALPSTPVRQRERIHAAIDELEAGGSTNGGEGLALAYRVAQAEFIPGGINRVILATDGDFNVGVTSHADLLRLIDEKKRSGIFLSVLGVGTGNIKDDTMEMLADRGNGTYAYLDTLQEARRVLVKDAGATLETVAKDVKFQVEFNPTTVAAWKLIGYENRLLAAEDFNDDEKDGGEIGAGHTVTVLYEIVPAGSPSPKGVVSDGGNSDVDPLRYQRARQPIGSRSPELATVKLRYKAPQDSVSQLIEHTVGRPSATTRDLPFASMVAELGLLLRDPTATPSHWAALVKRARGLDGPGLTAERAGAIELVELAASLSRRR